MYIKTSFNNSGCGSTKQGGYYKYNFATKTEIKVSMTEFGSLEDEYHNFYAKKDGTTIGENVYFLYAENYSLFNDDDYMYFLKRYNTKTGTTEIMQCWLNSDRTNYEEKMYYSHELWFIYDYHIIGKALVDFNNFTVLPY